MFDVDHIVLRTPDRDGELGALARAVGLPVLEGFAPEGRRVARGLRFSNGPFIDVHQSDDAPPVFLGLAGGVGKAHTLGEDLDWGSRVSERGAGPEAEPWSILSFRRGQGVLSRLFVIEYAEDEAAWRSEVFNGGLYHLPPEDGPSLRRVWLTAADATLARDVLLAFDYASAGEVESSVWPHRGRLFHGRRADIVLADGEDAVVRADIETDGPVRTLRLGANFTVTMGREA